MKDFWKRHLIISLMLFSVLVAVSFNEMKRRDQYMDNFKLASEVLVMQVPVDDANKYLHGMDMSKPVEMIHIKVGDRFIQYQVPGAPQGNFYALEGSTPTQLGISPMGYDPKTKTNIQKQKRVYKAIKEFDALSTYARPVVDNWSTPEIETQTEGKQLQIFTTCKPCFKEAMN